MRLAADLYRVADVAVFAAAPKEDYPERPPLLIVEILTREDRYHYVMEKLEDYRVWGVPNIWLIDPYAKRFWSYSKDCLRNSSSLALAEYPLELTPAALFSDL